MLKNLLNWPYGLRHRQGFYVSGKCQGIANFLNVKVISGQLLSKISKYHREEFHREMSTG